MTVRQHHVGLAAGMRHFPKWFPREPKLTALEPQPFYFSYCEENVCKYCVLSQANPVATSMRGPWCQVQVGQRLVPQNVTFRSPSSLKIRDVMKVRTQARRG